MEKASRYNIGMYTVLLAASIVLLAWENALLFWLWLFLLLCYALFVLLNDFLLKEKHWWNGTLTAVQCVLVLLISYVTVGYGSVPLAIAAQAGICARYGRKVSVWLSAALYLLLICTIYLTPAHDVSSPYPAIYIVVAGLVALLLFLSVKDAACLLNENMEKINELQLNRKELRDLNRQMKQYSADMEKITILRERSRMSKQIHDTLGHVLTAVSVQLGAAELLVRKSPEEALTKIANAKAQTREGLNSIKKTLSLIDEDSLQFEDRMMEVIRKAEDGMNIRILAQISIKQNLSASVQDFMAAALKEGITNAVRHGGASAFVLRLTADSHSTVFYLEDNGRGCEKINMGYGLTAMEKQAQSHGGTLEVHSVQEEGFVLEISLPERRTADDQNPTG